MLATLLWTAGMGQGLGEVPRLPAPAPMRMAPAERWAIQSVPIPSVTRVDTQKPRKVQANGRTVTISPNGEFEHIDGIKRGSDGSLLIHRGHRAINWSSQDSIWFKGKEAPVPHGYVSFYRDRLNYAGYRIRDLAPNGMPMSPPEAYVVEKGKRRSLGFGYLSHWGKDGTFVLAAPVDGQGVPANPQDNEATVLRVIFNGRASAFPGYEFVGVDESGTVAMASGARIVRARAGKVVGFYELPDRWRVSGLSPKGWLLLRRLPAEKVAPMPELPKSPEEMKEWSAKMSAWEKADENSLTATERDWTAAVAMDGALAPLEFSRPAKTSHLLWRSSRDTLGADAFRFLPFGGNDERAFRLSAPAHSIVRKK